MRLKWWFNVATWIHDVAMMVSGGSMVATWWLAH